MIKFTAWLHVSHAGNIYYRKQTFYKLIIQKVYILYLER